MTCLTTVSVQFPVLLGNLYRNEMDLGYMYEKREHLSDFFCACLYRCCLLIAFLEGIL